MHKQFILLLTIAFGSITSYAQESDTISFQNDIHEEASSFQYDHDGDTVFLRYDHNDYDDSLIYKTDTIIFPSAMQRRILVATTALPGTDGYLITRAWGLDLRSVTKSECQNDGMPPQFYEDRFYAITETDSSLIIDIAINANCCHDFLGDVYVDEKGVLNLLYHSYGANCACDCCFGLTYYFLKDESIHGALKSVMIRGNRKTMRPLAKPPKSSKGRK